MALMNAEVYDALKEAGASEEKARAAASSIATYDVQFADIKGELRIMQGELRLIRWMVTLTLALVVPVAVTAISLLFGLGR